MSAPPVRDEPSAAAPARERPRLNLAKRTIPAPEIKVEETVEALKLDDAPKEEAKEETEAAPAAPAEEEK
jgi:hypothetical protein